MVAELLHSLEVIVASLALTLQTRGCLKPLERSASFNQALNHVIDFAKEHEQLLSELPKQFRVYVELRGLLKASIVVYLYGMQQNREPVCILALKWYAYTLYRRAFASTIPHCNEKRAVLAWEVVHSRSVYRDADSHLDVAEKLVTSTYNKWKGNVWKLYTYLTNSLKQAVRVWLSAYRSTTNVPI